MTWAQERADRKLLHTHASVRVLSVSVSLSLSLSHTHTHPPSHTHTLSLSPQIVFVNGPDLHHKSPDSGERQYKYRACDRRFDPALGAHICMYTSISLYLSIHPSIYLSIYLYIFIHIYICLSIYLSIYRYIYTHIYIYIYTNTYTWAGAHPDHAAHGPDVRLHVT